MLSRDSGSGILHGQLHGFFPLDSLDLFGMNTQIGQTVYVTGLMIGVKTIVLWIWAA